MFFDYKFNEITYTNGIKLPIIKYNPNLIYQKFILTISDVGITKFISYIPNFKFRNKNFSLKKLSSKHFKTKKNNCFKIYSYTTNTNILVDFLNDSDKFLPCINIFEEDFTEQKSNNILFYVHKTLLFCDYIIDYSPILSIFATNLLQFCQKQLENYPPFEDIDVNLYKIFSDKFENLYYNFTSSLSNSISMIDSTFIDYAPKFQKLEMPKQTILISKNKKEEINKELNSKNYKTKFYSTINSSLQIFEIKNTENFINACLFDIISNKIPIRKCKNCSKYFISKRRDTMYCNNPSPQNHQKTCSVVRNHLNSTQLELNEKIRKKYEKFFNLCISKSKKQPELYNQILDNFKKEYHQKQEDIIYYRYKRSEMLKWLDTIIENPLLLKNNELDDLQELLNNIK